MQWYFEKSRGIWYVPWYQPQKSHGTWYVPWYVTKKICYTGMVRGMYHGMRFCTPVRQFIPRQIPVRTPTYKYIYTSN